MPGLSLEWAWFGMKWIRSNIRYGSRLALFALAVQFVLSFGHFHGVAAQATPAIQSGPAGLAHANGLPTPDAVNQSARQQQPASDRDSDQSSNDLCAICAVVAMATTALFAPPPLLLLLPQAVEFLYLTTDAEFIHLHSACVVFQSRAPPIS